MNRKSAFCKYLELDVGTSDPHLKYCVQPSCRPERTVLIIDLLYSRKPSLFEEV